MIDGVWLEIFVEDYVQFLGNKCAFCIQEYDDYISILGNVIMRNFYVIHDMDHKKTAFGVLKNVDQAKQKPVRGSIPRCAFNDQWCENDEATVYVCWDKSQITEKEKCPKIGGYICDSGLATTLIADCELEQVPATQFEC